MKEPCLICGKPTDGILSASGVRLPLHQVCVLIARRRRTMIEPCYICWKPTEGHLSVHGVIIPIHRACVLIARGTPSRCPDCGGVKVKRAARCNDWRVERQRKLWAAEAKVRTTCPACGGTKGRRSQECRACYLKRFE